MWKVSSNQQPTAVHPLVTLPHHQWDRGENKKRKSKTCELRQTLVAEGKRKKNRWYKRSHSLPLTSRPMPSHSPSNKHFGRQLLAFSSSPVWLLSMTLFVMECPIGRSGSLSQLCRRTGFSLPPLTYLLGGVCVGVYLYSEKRKPGHYIITVQQWSKHSCVTNTDLNTNTKKIAPCVLLWKAYSIPTDPVQSVQ